MRGVVVVRSCQGLSVNKSHRDFANPHRKVGRSKSQERY